MKICVRCQKPIPPEERRTKFCSDACADSSARARLKLRKAAPTPRRLYRYYPKTEDSNA
jgi:hypothetical protein